MLTVVRQVHMNDERFLIQLYEQWRLNILQE